MKLINQNFHHPTLGIGKDKEERKKYHKSFELPSSPWFLPLSAMLGVEEVDLFDDVIPRFKQSNPIEPNNEMPEFSGRKFRIHASWIWAILFLFMHIKLRIWFYFHL